MLNSGKYSYVGVAPLPLEAMFVPSMSSTSSPPGTNPTFSATSASPSSSGKATPASMTLLFGTLVIFSSIFAAFLLLCFFWQYRRAQRRVVVLEYDETIGTYKSVPKMWEVWTQHEPGGSQRHWESFRVSCATTSPGALFLRLAEDPAKNVQPLSANVERAPRVNHDNPEPMTSRASNLRRFAFRRPTPTPHTEVPPHSDVEVAASVPMSNLHMTFIIAMPHRDPPNRRQSVLSQGTSVNGDWGNREYAIGIYHAPFREESSAESSV